MKNSILALGLILASNSFAQSTQEEWDQHFQSKISGYIKDGGLTVTLTKANLNGPSDNGTKIIFKACQQERCDVIKNLGPNLELSLKKPFSFKSSILTNDLDSSDVNFVIEARKDGKLIGQRSFESRPIIRSLIFGAKKEILKIHKLVNYDLNITLRSFQSGIRSYDLNDVTTEDFKRPMLLLDVLSKEKEIQDLMAADAGVHEGYTIKEHNLRVLERLNEDYSCHFKSEFESKMSDFLGAPLKNFFQVTMSLHDIGKPLAVRMGDKSRQHEFTRPIVEIEMKKYGFSDAAIKTAVNLVDNDVIGDYLQGKLKLKDALVDLVKLSNSSGLALDDYFRLQIAFFTSDAGAYPYLAGKVFAKRKQDGCFLPKARSYAELEAHVNLLMGIKEIFGL